VTDLLRARGTRGPVVGVRVLDADGVRASSAPRWSSAPTGCARWWAGAAGLVSRLPWPQPPRLPVPRARPARRRRARRDARRGPTGSSASPTWATGSRTSPWSRRRGWRGAGSRRTARRPASWTRGWPGRRSWRRASPAPSAWDPCARPGRSPHTPACVGRRRGAGGRRGGLLRPVHRRGHLQRAARRRAAGPLRRRGRARRRARARRLRAGAARRVPRQVDGRAPDRARRRAPPCSSTVRRACCRGAATWPTCSVAVAGDFVPPPRC
jgi:hypothetical protein